MLSKLSIRCFINFGNILVLRKLNIKYLYQDGEIYLPSTCNLWSKEFLDKTFGQIEEYQEVSSTEKNKIKINKYYYKINRSFTSLRI